MLSAVAVVRRMLYSHVLQPVTSHDQVRVVGFRAAVVAAAAAGGPEAAAAAAAVASTSTGCCC